jgi:gamma-glutamyl hercynylcysteine S-oxide synthase
MVGNIRQWTVTLWGEKRLAPDTSYAYPWKDDRRNDLNANRQIRRVVRGGSFQEDAQYLRCSARSGQFPDDAGLLGIRHGFRVVMSI